MQKRQRFSDRWLPPAGRVWRRESEWSEGEDYGYRGIQSQLPIG